MKLPFSLKLHFLKKLSRADEFENAALPGFV